MPVEITVYKVSNSLDGVAMMYYVCIHDRRDKLRISLTSQIPVDKWHAFIGEPKIS